jgi:hypothetical protein
MLTDIAIRIIPHDQQRYPTVGDWYTDEHGVTHISVSNLGNWRMEFAIAIHELTEWALCRHQGVSQREVDEFDTTYTGPCIEPGDDPKSPYRMAHCVATGVERIVIALLGVSWRDYDEKVNSL